MSTKDLLVSQRRKQANARWELWRHQMTCRELEKERPRRPARGHVATICREAVAARRQATQGCTRLLREGEKCHIKDVSPQRPIVASGGCRHSTGIGNKPLRKRPMSAGSIPIRTHSQRRPLSAGAIPVRVPSESPLQILAQSDPSRSAPCITREVPGVMRELEVGRCPSIDQESSHGNDGFWPQDSVAREFDSDLHHASLDRKLLLTADVLHRALEDASSSDSNSVLNRPRPASAPATRSRPSLIRPKFPSQQSEAVQAILRGQMRLQTVPDSAAYIYMETESRRAFPAQDEPVPAIQVRSNRNLPTAPV